MLTVVLLLSSAFDKPHLDIHVPRPWAVTTLPSTSFLYIPLPTFAVLHYLPRPLSPSQEDPFHILIIHSAIHYHPTSNHPWFLRPFLPTTPRLYQSIPSISSLSINPRLSTPATVRYRFTSPDGATINHTTPTQATPDGRTLPTDEATIPRGPVLVVLPAQADGIPPTPPKKKNKDHQHQVPRCRYLHLHLRLYPVRLALSTLTMTLGKKKLGGRHGGEEIEGQMGAILDAGNEIVLLITASSIPLYPSKLVVRDDACPLPSVPNVFPGADVLFFPMSSSLGVTAFVYREGMNAATVNSGSTTDVMISRIVGSAGNCPKSPRAGLRTRRKNMLAGSEVPTAGRSLWAGKVCDGSPQSRGCVYLTVFIGGSRNARPQKAQKPCLKDLENLQTTGERAGEKGEVEGGRRACGPITVFTLYILFWVKPGAEGSESPIGLLDGGCSQSGLQDQRRPGLASGTPLRADFDWAALLPAVLLSVLSILDERGTPQLHNTLD
ncbi:hypothetical protein FPV67DRAFT_1460802 [Lyophyllum atratum]|nr:hypothetical protein FPV67DRAFT_1460802 [Lyophyllum atratum]